MQPLYRSHPPTPRNTSYSATHLHQPDPQPVDPQLYEPFNLKSNSPGDNTANPNVPLPYMNFSSEEPPTHVVGSQGRRGILPSDPGRPAAPAAGTGSAKSTVIPVKDADGKFPCPHCTKTYLHAKHLKRHLLRHTGDRPYMCVLCRDMFSRSDDLKRHFQTCAIRRGNPTGASHLSHPQAHVKKNAQAQKAADTCNDGDMNDPNSLNNMTSEGMVPPFGMVQVNEGRASPLPRPHIRSAPYSVGASRNKRSSTDSSSTTASPLVAPIMENNADHHSLHGHSINLSDPPDLFSSLHEEQAPPPPEDMNPSDPNMIPHEQELRFEGDLYTPKWVRGHGNKREGWCGTCKPGRWLVLKNSTFWYDKSFTHGICAATGSPFQEPRETRRKDDNPNVWEGLCGSCEDWIVLVGSKKIGTTWFRHANKCHIKKSRMP